MAVCLDTRYRKTKCKDFRNGVQFGLWFWWLQCVVCLPCIFSKCLDVDITVSVHPSGDINIRYGDPLEIFCIAENYTSDDLVFMINGKALPSEKVNSTTRRLYIEKPPKQQGTYYCRHNKTLKNCINRVLVDSPPANVTDFGCRSKNLNSLNCSWTTPDLYSNTNYSLTFLILGNSVQPCIAERTGRLRYCTWDSNSQPRYRQQEENYFFHLKACNVFGCNEQNFSIDHFSVVKPDPITDLKILNNGTHSVTLQWNLPFNMIDLLPHHVWIQHKIEYQIAKIDNTAYFRQVDVSGLPPNNKTYKFELANLPYAHMQYEVRIYIKLNKASDDYWSDFMYIVFYTASEKPSRPPDMAPGAFTQSAFNTEREINIYWKQLEEYEEAGANFTYRVLISYGNKSITKSPDKNKSLSYVELHRAPLEAMEVSVWSVNMNGSSEKSSHLYIPPEWDTHSLSLASFTKLAYENGTYELSWVGIKNIDNYTLFWCQHNTTDICVGRMNFTVLEAFQNRHVIDLPREHRYQFAISANNGSKTSGMIWANCEISRNGIALYRYPVKLHHDKPGKSFVKVRWSMDCALQDGIVTGYKITYCPVIRTSSLCDKAVGNQSIYISDPKIMEVNITKLLPFRTYQFTIGLNTIYGLKTVDNISTEVTTTEDTPTSPRNVMISDMEEGSVTISYDPPLHRNGNIGKYVIYNYSKEFKIDKVMGTDVTVRRFVKLDVLPYTNYSFTVQACNNAIGLCSVIGPNDAIYLRTRFGPPSKLKAPIIKNNPDLIKWEEPEIPGGTLDLYQVKRIKDDRKAEIIDVDTKDKFLSVTHCEGVTDSETYQVRALNFDTDPNHGVLAFVINVTSPVNNKNGTEVYPGEWSEPSTVTCRGRDGLTMTLIFMALFILIGVVYLSIKLYKKYRKMGDIKPVFPNGLGIPEKDISRYAFGGWNPSEKDEKPPSDEMLLLPNSKAVVPSPETQQKESNCGASDHTDSTALSDSSRGPVDRQVSTSEDGSNSSLQLEGTLKSVDNKNSQAEHSSNSETESSRENSPYFSNKVFKKNPASGYVQPVANPITGYVQSAPAPVKSPSLKPIMQPASSSYVMAGLSPPIFTTDVAPPSINHRPASSGYVRAEDTQAKSMMNFPKLGPAPTKLFGPESLPTMPSLPPSTKHGADSSYIQLQSLDALPSLKPIVRNSVPLKPSASSGYVSPGDAVINKHLNNMLSAGQLAEESAILDPTMSPDAYCRFSWSTDPANDNLHSLLAESPALKSSKD